MTDTLAHPLSEPGDLESRYPGVAGKPHAMALLCTPLIRLGRHVDAYTLGRAALALAPADTAIRAIVDAALSAGVPKYHLGMLRDAPRNACYATAIARLVRPGMRVLDIGTGTGLLAMLAARAGAEVVTCESNPVIAAAAREIVARNGFADRIRVVARRSTALEIGREIGCDMAERCDLLVSEVFGDGLFEEGVMATIDDARARLLRPGAPIVPPRAALRCALMIDDRPRRPALDSVLGFDLSPFASLTRPRRSLPHAPSGDTALRSPVVSALATDFMGEAGTPHERIALTSAGGRIDGVAQWLHPDFGDGVTYENTPFASPLAHWAIVVHAFAAPIDTRPNEVIEADVQVLANRTIISLGCGPGIPGRDAASAG